MPIDFSECLHEHLDALQTKDVARFAATLGDDVTVIDGRGERTHGTASVLRSHAAWFAAAEPWTFEYSVVFTRVFEGAALALIDVTYRHSPDAVPARFVLSLVFARAAAGAWKFVYDQNTPLTNAAG